jgi:hypothetical protein
MFGEFVAELLELLYQTAVSALIINCEMVWTEKAPTHSGD